jgi:hypothetical protein
MMLSTVIAVEPAPDTQQGALELLLQDRGWVEAEFAAIMNASGVDDPLLVGTIPRPPQRDRDTWTPTTTREAPGADRLRPTKSASRVRSPPRH